MADEGASILIEDEETIAEYYDLRKQLDTFNYDLRDVLNHPTYALPFLQSGRLVRIKIQDEDFDWGCVVSFNRRYGPQVGCSLHRLPIVKSLRSSGQTISG